MKTTFLTPKYLLVAMTVAFAAPTAISAQTPVAAAHYAADENPLKARVTRLGTSLNFDVRFENTPGVKTTVLVEDTQDRLLFRDAAYASDSRYARRFDLSGLEDGTYTFVITNGTEKYSQSFEIRTEVQTSRLVVEKQ